MEKPYSIEQAKSTLYNILKEFADFCDAHHLRY